MTDVEVRVMHYEHEGAMSQAMCAASRSRKSHGNGFFSELAAEMQSYRHLDFSPVKLILDFRFLDLSDNKFMLF